jgi:hypothetical protein
MPQTAGAGATYFLDEHPVSAGYEGVIRNNALYSLLGPAIRRMWKVEDQFYPELLREVGLIQYDVLDDTAHLSNSHI